MNLSIYQGCFQPASNNYAFLPLPQLNTQAQQVHTKLWKAFMIECAVRTNLIVSADMMSSEDIDMHTLFIMWLGL